MKNNFLNIIYRFGLLIIMSAAITPGIQPQMVRIKTIKMDPHPLSITARGGNKIESNTLQILIEQIYDYYSCYEYPSIRFCYIEVFVSSYFRLP